MALALNVKNTGQPSVNKPTSTPQSISLNSVGAGDAVVFVFKARADAGAPSVLPNPTATGLTFTARGSITGSGTGEYLYNYVALNAASGNYTINFGMDQTWGFFTPVVAVFSISGNPLKLDSNASLPKTYAASSSPVTQTINTSQTNDFIWSAQTSASDAGTGFTKIYNNAEIGFNLEYKVVSSAQSSMQILYTGSPSNILLIADAVSSDAPGTPRFSQSRRPIFFRSF